MFIHAEVIDKLFGKVLGFSEVTADTRYTYLM